MRSSYRKAVFCLVLVLPVLQPQPCSAQLDGATLLEKDVVGYADPQDDTSIFDYRLPSWGYWTYDVTGAFNGRGSNRSSESLQVDDDQLLFDLGGRSRRYFESEDDQLTFDLELNGSYTRENSSTAEDDTTSGSAKRRNYLTDLRLDVDWYHYFAPQLAWTLGGGTDLRYWELVRDTDEVANTRIDRTAAFRARVGLSVGRLREVTPVLRAERIAERFVALGRPRPSRGQVLILARQIAQRTGYQQSFERPNKFFGPAVLAELVAEADLTPFEVLYLLEALDEPLARREEGLRLDTRVALSRRTGDELEDESGTEIRVLLNWSHNLSLVHQLSALAGVSSTERHSTEAIAPNADRTQEQWTLRGQHLWEIADRFTLISSARYEKQTSEIDGTSDSATNQVAFSTQAHYFVEDHLSLRPSFGWSRTSLDASFMGVDDDEVVSKGWQVGVSIAYVRDRLLPVDGF